MIKMPFPKGYNFSSLRRKSEVPEHTEHEKELIALGIDFEGCIGIYKQYKKEPCYYIPFIGLASTDRRLTDFWHQLVGAGSVTSQIRNSEKNPKWKDAYYWRLRAANDVVTLLEQIEPYLISKGKQARIVIYAINGEISMKKGYLKCRELNKRCR